jgi:L-serine dehydratase
LADKNGLSREGVLPGGLRLPRKAAGFKTKATSFNGPFKKRSFLFVYAWLFQKKMRQGEKL